MRTAPTGPPALTAVARVRGPPTAVTSRPAAPPRSPTPRGSTRAWRRAIAGAAFERWAPAADTRSPAVVRAHSLGWLARLAPLTRLARPHAEQVVKGPRAEPPQHGHGRRDHRSLQRRAADRLPHAHLADGRRGRLRRVIDLGPDGLERSFAEQVAEHP